MPLIRKLEEAVTIFSVPFSRFGIIPDKLHVCYTILHQTNTNGIALGGRSTAIKMASGKVVVFASTPCDAETSKTLNEMTIGGSVSHIIVLDAVHALYVSQFAQAYPQAKLVAPKGVLSKKKDLNFDIVLPDSPLDPELEKEFRAIPMTGHPNEDVVWYHKPTKTLVQADVLFNLPSKEQASFSLIPQFMLSQMSPGATMHSLMASAFSKPNPKAFGAAAREIASLDIKRIIPCHGDVIEGTSAANEAWRKVYGKFLAADSKAN